MLAELPQIDRGRFLNLKPSQKSGLSNTSGAGERSAVWVPVGGNRMAGPFPLLVTLMGLLVAEVSRLLDSLTCGNKRDWGLTEVIVPIETERPRCGIRVNAAK
jgi:hypothetical protein